MLHWTKEYLKIKEPPSHCKPGISKENETKRTYIQVHIIQKSNIPVERFPAKVHQAHYY